MHGGGHCPHSSRAATRNTRPFSTVGILPEAGASTPPSAVSATACWLSGLGKTVGRFISSGGASAGRPHEAPIPGMRHELGCSCRLHAEATREACDADAPSKDPALSGSLSKVTITRYRRDWANRPVQPVHSDDLVRCCATRSQPIPGSLRMISAWLFRPSRSAGRPRMAR